MKGTSRTFLIVLAMATILATVTTGAAVAAKGHHSVGSSTISVVLLNSTDGAPHWGQTVTFSVSTTATDQPSVKLDCYQGGVRVYTHMAGFYPDYPWPWSQNFTLRSSVWTSGAADCTAELYYMNSRGRSITLTTLSFHVYA